METINYTVEQSFIALFHTAMEEKDPTTIFRQLEQGKGYGIEAGVYVRFASFWYEVEPLHSVMRPDCLALDVGWPMIIVPWYGGMDKLFPFGEFCDRFDAWLAEYYYPKHPEHKDDVAAALAGLRAYLAGQPQATGLPPLDPDRFYLDVDEKGPQPDMAVLLEYLLEAAQANSCAPTGITCWSDVYPEEPDDSTDRAAFLTMTTRLTPAEPQRYQEFFQRLGHYLDTAYYPLYPDQQPQIEQLVTNLQNTLTIPG